MAKARLQDIAAQAGVSEATVSRVLNGKPGVAAGTRLAVVAALDLLGYARPARLRERSAGLVGLVVPELDNPIFPAFAQTIESVLAQHGYTPVLCTQAPGGVSEDEYVEMLLERGVSGIVFVSGLHADSTAGPERYHRLLAHRVPIVLVNGYAPAVPATFFSTDDAAAMALAVGHLIALGHRRVGLAVGPPRFVPVARKVEAFLGCLGEALGSPVSPADAVEHTFFSVEGGTAAATALLERGCTALVCGSDLMALGAVRAARAGGLSVPHDISVVGFDDSPLMAYTDPPLTTLRQSVRAIGHAAVQALVDEIAGNAAPRREFLFSPELVVRGSTGSAVPR